MRQGLITLLQFIGFALAQVLLFRQLTVGDIAFLHLHVLFLLFLPAAMRLSVGLLLAFAFGFAISTVDRPLAAHAFACVNLVVLRGWWMAVITPGLSASREPLDFSRQTPTWLVTYITPLVAVYELSYLPLANLLFSWSILASILLSTLYTSAIGLMVVFLLYRRR
jgi:hypothetical protein